MPDEQWIALPGSLPDDTARTVLHTKERMARQQNTFEKLRREMEKKRKAKEKRERKRLKKEDASDTGDTPTDAVEVRTQRVKSARQMTDAEILRAARNA
ncbi:MAG: hypothetical protein AAF266_00995 [Planctomycetota bacterium]